MFSLQTYKSEKNIKPLLIMRNSTFRKFLLFLLLLPTYLCTTAWAQLSELEQGKVYRFVNVGQSSYALAATTTKGATGSTVTTGSTQADYPQLWYVTEVKDNSGTKTYRLRNMGNGLYLQGNEKSTANTKRSATKRPRAATATCTSTVRKTWWAGKRAANQRSGTSLR